MMLMLRQKYKSPLVHEEMSPLTARHPSLRTAAPLAILWTSVNFDGPISILLHCPHLLALGHRRRQALAFLEAEFLGLSFDQRPAVVIRAYLRLTVEPLRMQAITRAGKLIVAVLAAGL